MKVPAGLSEGPTVPLIGMQLGLSAILEGAWPARTKMRELAIEPAKLEELPG